MNTRWSPAERAAFEARRKSRNLALGLLLGALVLLFFGITVVRMAPGIVGGKPGIGPTQTAPVNAPAP